MHRNARLIVVAISCGATAACFHGGVGSGGVTRSSERFRMHDARSQNAAATLANGDVLVAGGLDRNGEPLATAEVFDVSRLSNGRDDEFVTTGSMSVARASFAAVPLASGEVLVVGGSPDPRAERFVPDASNPANGTFVATAGGLIVPRRRLAAAQLADGRVLVSGGDDALAAGDAPLASAEIFDPSTDAFAATGPMSVARAEHTLTSLPDGRVLAAGGRTASGDPTATAEVFDPATGSWTRVDALNEGRGELSFARFAHSAVRLGDGTADPSDDRVVLAGGTGVDGGGIAAVEAFDPTTASFGLLGDLAAPPASGLAGVALLDGDAVFLGGRTRRSSSGALDTPIREAALVRLVPAAATAGIQDLPRPIAEPVLAAISIAGSHTGTEILIAGGVESDGDPVSDAILFDPFEFDRALADTLDDQEALVTATLAMLFALLDDGTTGTGIVDLSVVSDPVSDTLVRGAIGGIELSLAVDAGSVVGTASTHSFSLGVEEGVVDARGVLITFSPGRVTGFLEPSSRHFTLDATRTGNEVNGTLVGTDTLRSAIFRIVFAGSRTDVSLSTITVR